MFPRQGLQYVTNQSFEEENLATTLLPPPSLIYTHDCIAKSHWLLSNPFLRCTLMLIIWNYILIPYSYMCPYWNSEFRILRAILKTRFSPIPLRNSLPFLYNWFKTYVIEAAITAWGSVKFVHVKFHQLI